MGKGRVDLMLSNQVDFCCGTTVLISLQAKPRIPLMLVSLAKVKETEMASSIAWLGTIAPPILASPRPTMPLAVLESPYWIAQL